MTERMEEQELLPSANRLDKVSALAVHRHLYGSNLRQHRLL